MRRDEVAVHVVVPDQEVMPVAGSPKSSAIMFQYNLSLPFAYSDRAANLTCINQGAMIIEM